MSNPTDAEVTESLNALLAEMTPDERAVFDEFSATPPEPYNPELPPEARAYAATRTNATGPVAGNVASLSEVLKTMPDQIQKSVDTQATFMLAQHLAKQRAAQLIADNPGGDTFEDEVAIEVHRDRVRTEARKIRLTETSAFGLFDASELITAEDVQNDSEIESLIEGVLERETVSMLVADSYVGKSYLGIDWGMSIACGLDWHGRPVQSGKVLYLMMEGSKTTRARIAAWSEARQVDLDGLGDNFVVYNRTVNFMDQDSVEALADTVRDRGIDLVIIDTLSRAIGGANENSAEDMGQFVAAVAQVREAREGASVLIVHHTKKENKSEYRGSTVLFAAMDTIWCLTRGDDATPFRTLENQKMKSGVLAPVQHMIFEPCLDSATLEPTNLLAGDVTLITLQAMLMGGAEVTRAGLKERLVADGAYASENAAGNRIKALEDGGKLETYGTRKGLVRMPLDKYNF